jgi:hypothetical protein
MGIIASLKDGDTVQRRIGEFMAGKGDEYIVCGSVSIGEIMSFGETLYREDGVSLSLNIQNIKNGEVILTREIGPKNDSFGIEEIDKWHNCGKEKREIQKALKRVIANQAGRVITLSESFDLSLINFYPVPSTNRYIL